MSELERIKKRLCKIRDDREWNQFHTPKDLSISVSLEAAELLELFQWKNIDADTIKNDSHLKERFEEEIADIANYLILMCDQLDIDLEKAINSKITKSEKKYPIEKAKGNCKKYTEF